MEDDFYVRYYQGHKTPKFGHEYLEFEFRSNGLLRYANDSQYKRDSKITKQVFVNQCVLNEVKKMIEDSGIERQDDSKWPEPDRVGRQELEIVMNNEHMSLTCQKIGSLLDVQSSEDPEGMRIFYYLVQDLKCLVFTLISMHFKINPI